MIIIGPPTLHTSSHSESSIIFADTQISLQHLGLLPMDTRIRTASPLPSDAIRKLEPDPSTTDKISAYYSLIFPTFTFYIQTLSVTIGRRTIQPPNAATSSSSSTEPAQVDVDLGALKSVSRLHAKIEYDQDEDRFVLAVIGRNGAWVDGVWSGSGSRAPLGERCVDLYFPATGFFTDTRPCRSQIQIASRTFHFVLPPPPPPEDTPSPSSQSSGANNRPRSPSLDITSISPPSSQPSHSPPPPTEPKLPPPPPEPQLTNAVRKPTGKGNSKKRKKSEAEQAEPPKPKPKDLPPKPPLTYAQLIYRAITAIGGKATLMEICDWVTATFEYYQYADNAWTVRFFHLNRGLHRSMGLMLTTLTSGPVELRAA